MKPMALLFMLSCSVPLVRAWMANRQTSLLQAINWVIAAWAGWAMAIVISDESQPLATRLGNYLALCLTGCAGIAVLGARRPSLVAWNFVVFGLLAVNLLPVFEALPNGGRLRLDVFRGVCVAATIAAGILNYLPTRIGLGAVLLLAGCAGVYYAVATENRTVEWGDTVHAGHLAIAGAGWLSFAMVASRPRPASQFDKLWLGFRDSFGFVWAQRLREQFNRSAYHSGWQVVLRWQGLRLKQGTLPPGQEAQTEMLETLRALLKRFGPVASLPCASGEERPA